MAPIGVDDGGAVRLPTPYGNGAITQIVVRLEGPRCVTTRLGVRLAAIERSSLRLANGRKVNPRYPTRLRLSKMALLTVKKSEVRL